jgi:uncharacterized integral membrane protein
MAERHGRPPEFRGTGIYWSLLVAVVLGGAILVGIVQNTQSVQLKYLGWDARTPLIAVLLIAIFVTAILTELLGVIWRWRRRGQLAARADLQDLQGRSPAPAVSASPESLSAGGIAPGPPPPMAPQPPPVPGVDPPRYP